jgi:prephenate dehydratase
VIQEIAPKLRQNQLLMDITSLKEAPIQAMKQSKAAVIGLHPMFNDSTYGPGQTIIIIPVKPKKWLPWLNKIFDEENLRVKKMSAQKHDHVMAVVQGLVHAAEISFVHALKIHKTKAQDIIDYAGPAATLKILMAARILAQSKDLYGQIQIENNRNSAIQKQYVNSLKELTKIVEEKEYEKFNAYFESCARHLGKFRKEALKETDWMIAEWLEKKKPVIKQLKKASKKNAIAVLGPALTFSDFAADFWIKLRGQKEKVYAENIREALKMVEKNEVEETIVPLENRIHGTVRDTLDTLFDSNLEIKACFRMPIHLSLCVYPGSAMEKIKAVMSHPQTFYQCETFLRKHLPKVEYLAASSTVAAMENVIRLKKEHIAVIGNRKAAEKLGLKILKNNIENDTSNETTFIVVASKKIKGAAENDKFSAAPKTKSWEKRTMIVFHFSKDAPGSLASIFQIFKKFHKILYKIDKVKRS